MTLSTRQKEIAIAIAEGKTGQQIADELGLHPSTVDTHRSIIYRTLGVNNAVLLTHEAIRRGWVRVKGQRGRPRKET